MKVAIAGAGNVGRFLTEDLAGNGHEVVLIDRDPIDWPRCRQSRASAT